MEKLNLKGFDYKDYRDDLAETLKSQPDKETRKKILEGGDEISGERDTVRYKVAEQQHRKDIQRVKNTLYNQSGSDEGSEGAQHEDQKILSKQNQSGDTKKTKSESESITDLERKQEVEKVLAQREMVILEAEYKKLRDEYLGLKDIPTMPDNGELNKYYSISIDENEVNDRWGDPQRVIKFKIIFNYDLYRTERKNEMMSSPLYELLKQADNKIENLKQHSSLRYLIPFYSKYVRGLHERQRKLIGEIEKYEKDFNAKTYRLQDQKQQLVKDMEEELNQGQEGRDNPRFTLGMFLRAGLSFGKLNQEVYEKEKKDWVKKPFAHYHGSYLGVFSAVKAYNEGISKKQQRLNAQIESIQSRMRAISH